jgi:predicted short-subunit dehydrogenase-like oxidoreductase (DUF2520 family)
MCGLPFQKNALRVKHIPARRSQSIEFWGVSACYLKTQLQSEIAVGTELQRGIGSISTSNSLATPALFAKRRQLIEHRGMAKGNPGGSKRRRSKPANSLMGGIAIVGPGRIGQSLGRLLHDAGVPIRVVAARRRAAALKATRFIGDGEALALGTANLEQLASAAVTLVTISDASLPQIALTLAQVPIQWKGHVVLHTCGSLPSTVLQPLKFRGAAIGSLHPFQTVPSREAGVRNLRGTFWGIEGDRQANRMAENLVLLLGGTSFRINAARKTLYHAAAFLVCPTIVTLLHGSEGLMAHSGAPRKLIRPMLAAFVSETLRNYRALGPHDALTGPAVRGDWLTIRRHLQALRETAPGIVPEYKELTRSMLRLAARKLPPGLLD